MSYTDSINSYHKKQNGRDAFIAILSQYAVEDKWQKLLKDISEILQNQRCLGQETFTLNKFIAVRCNLCIMMTQFAEHVNYQLPKNRLV